MTWLSGFRVAALQNLGPYHSQHLFAMSDFHFVRRCTSIRIVHFQDLAGLEASVFDGWCTHSIKEL